MKKSDRFRKHLTLQDRYDIEDGLNHGYSLKTISEKISKDPTTVSKELRKRRIGNEVHTLNSNDCMYRLHCQKQSLCSECEKSKRCCSCKNVNCRVICHDYHSDMCRYTTRSPYVCNGCQSIYDCRKPHFFYRANFAYDTYKALLKDTREGIALTRQQLYDLDCLITPLLKRGQSLAHIYSVHKSEIPCSERTLYKYIDKGIFTVRNIDLPKKVKYKARKLKNPVPAFDYTYRDGRTYKDFQQYLEAHPDTNVVEIDTVHGSNKVGNVLLTLLFRNCSLMLIFVIPECTKECVKNVFDSFEEALGIEIFKKTFPVILTDNGPEFKGPEDIEKNIDDLDRTKVFFCDPLASWQKAKLEKNHEYIRKVIPKGIPLKDLLQKDVTLLANHINSTTRASLNGLTPFELAQLLLDKKLIEAAGLKLIPADGIMLKPSLLKH